MANVQSASEAVCSGGSSPSDLDSFCVCCCDLFELSFGDVFGVINIKASSFKATVDLFDAFFKLLLGGALGVFVTPGHHFSNCFCNTLSEASVLKSCCQLSTTN